MYEFYTFETVPSRPREVGAERGIGGDVTAATLAARRLVAGIPGISCLLSRAPWRLPDAEQNVDVRWCAHGNPPITCGDYDP